MELRQFQIAVMVGQLREEGRAGEEMELAGREWVRMEERLGREGYREGRAVAEEEALQEGFDQGYRQGFDWGRRVGRLRGRLAVVGSREGEEAARAVEEVVREVEALVEGDMRGLEVMEERVARLCRPE